MWTKDAIHLDDFHFTSQVEDMNQLLVDTAKHFGHFIGREDKKYGLQLFPTNPRAGRGTVINIDHLTFLGNGIDDD